VSKLKTAVYKDHRNRLDDLDAQLRDLKDHASDTKIQVNNIENNLTKMIRELVDFYIDQKVTPKFEGLVTKSMMKEALSVKMNFSYFKEYLKGQQENQAIDNKQFRTEERIFVLEQKVNGSVSKEELKQQLKLKASNERFIELRENMHKLQVMSVSSQDQFEKNNKAMQQDLIKKTSELNSYIHDLQLRIKRIEEEVNETESGGDQRSLKQGPRGSNFEMGSSRNQLGQEGEGDMNVNSSLDELMKSKSDIQAATTPHADGMEAI
jgi:small-conductance mechanosensitive channel